MAEIDRRSANPNKIIGLAFSVGRTPEFEETLTGRHDVAGRQRVVFKDPPRGLFIHVFRTARLRHDKLVLPPHHVRPLLGCLHARLPFPTADLCGIIFGSILAGADRGLQRSQSDHGDERQCLLHPSNIAAIEFMGNAGERGLEQNVPHRRAGKTAEYSFRIDLKL